MRALLLLLVTSVTKSHDGSHRLVIFHELPFVFLTNALAAEAAELFSLRYEIAMSFKTAQLSTS